MSKYLTLGACARGTVVSLCVYVCVYLSVTALTSGGSRGRAGSGGCNPPKSSEPYIQNALLILC